MNYFIFWRPSFLSRLGLPAVRPLKTGTSLGSLYLVLKMSIARPKCRKTVICSIIQPAGFSINPTKKAGYILNKVLYEERSLSLHVQ